MRKLFLVIAAVALLFCGYYFALSQGLKNALRDAPAVMAEDGLTLSLPTIKYSGFPLMVRADIADPQMSGLEGSLRAEHVRLWANVFKPTVWTAQTRGDLRVDWRGEADTRYLFDISPSLMQGTFSASITGRLNAARITGLKLSAQPVIGTAPPIRMVDKFIFDIAPSTDGMAFSLAVEDAYLDRESARTWQRAFGPHISQINLNGTASGLRALDDIGILEWKADGGFDIPNAEIIWGDMFFEPVVKLSLAGPQTSGQVDLHLRDADKLVDALIRADMLTGRAASFAPFALMAAPRDDTGRVVLSLPVENGKLMVFGQAIYPP